ncbi:MAG: three-Cys-motif partner protein TcmP [Candidatus Bathyarchaeota archaeon]|nr:three-Cys-motif partner protein TcmP [Candidatus Bathyarchaeum tardum]
MPLEFHKNAICLSGNTGTKLKSEVISSYYPFWLSITSGGPSRNFRNPTAIIELNAATGEVFIKDTGKTLFGSAGHALDLKVNSKTQTAELKVILVEQHPECFQNLTEVIRKRWPTIITKNARNGISINDPSILLLNTSLEEALDKLEDLELGNALYFFDPLRSVEFNNVETVARRRMNKYFQTGTEFIIFVFTSDWFIGRTDFIPLPSSANKEDWTQEQEKTILEADGLFGDQDWREQILNNEPLKKREAKLISEYSKRLRKWFRYVLPMPFNPKGDQIYHIILCSNFETGVRATRDYYCDITGNPRYSPKARKFFPIFNTLHPELSVNLTGNRRPLEWKLLWKTIRDHENGICDINCKDFIKEEKNPRLRGEALVWLEKKEYIRETTSNNAWGAPIPQYELNWKTLNNRLGLNRVTQLIPLAAEMINKK